MDVIALGDGSSHPSHDRQESEAFRQIVEPLRLAPYQCLELRIQMLFCALHSLNNQLWCRSGDGPFVAQTVSLFVIFTTFRLIEPFALTGSYVWAQLKADIVLYSP